MELIYAYIENYRTFHNKNISFSNKFIVNYNNDQLSIKRNADYIDIYPNNIIGISAIIGKNASGKTSLLSLIGDKIQTRIDNNEIWQNDLKDPHQKQQFDIYNIKEQTLKDVEENLNNISYNTVYFLLYYYEKNSDGEDLFILETDNPNKFKEIFINKKLFTTNGYSSWLRYCTIKGWFSCVFSSSQNVNQYLDDTQFFNKTYTTKYNKDYKSPKNLSSIIYFKKDYLRKSFYSFLEDQEEEHTISIKRRFSSLQNLYLYNQINFLIKQMKSKAESALFNDKVYYLNIRLSDTYISNPENEPDLNIMAAVMDYKFFSLETFSEQKKIILSFLYKFTLYRLATFIYSHSDISEEQILYIKKLQMTELHSYTFESIKEYYYRQIDIIFNVVNVEEYTIKRFKHAEKAFETFFDKEKEHNIAYSYNDQGLTLEINESSNISVIESFFSDCLDEVKTQNLLEEPSIFDNFFKAQIQWLSDGENENLSLFTAIHEQIDVYLSKKQKYILLFDEIERTMHPEMCRLFISDLINFLSAYPNKEFQIIISSHSPFIASDIRKENIILLTKKNNNNTDLKEMEKSPFGQNIHTILKSSFFLGNTFGEYSIKLIQMIQECLNKKTYEEAANEINQFLNFNGQFTRKTLLNSFESVSKYLELAILSIGEPIIKNYLQQQLKNWINNTLSIEEKINYYQKCIEKLKEEEKIS